MPVYIDIHSHIMPGVDDGSQDMDESISMLKMAEKENIRKVILTPHQKPDRKCVSVSGIQKRIEILREELNNLHIDIELYPGSELLYSHDLVTMLEHGSVCTLAGSHYVLVEFLPTENWPYIRDGLYGLTCAGYWPVVAHVERYVQVLGNIDRVEELIDMGCYIQMNAGSIVGDWGFSTKRACLKLLKNHLVHFVGTDAHTSGGKRSPQIGRCAELLKKKWDGYADELLWKNAAHILEDTEI